MRTPPLARHVNTTHPYTPAVATDIRKTFARARRKLAARDTADQLRTAVAAALGRGAGLCEHKRRPDQVCAPCGRYPEATQPTQAEAPSEREAREMQEVADKLREAGYHSAANNTERTIADIKSGNMPRAVIGAALATQQAVQGGAERLVARVRATGDFQLRRAQDTSAQHARHRADGTRR